MSSRRQEREGDLDRQVELLRELAEHEERRVVAIYRDVGSGLSDKRSGFTRMLKRMSDAQVSEVWVSTRDRLAGSRLG